MSENETVQFTHAMSSLGGILVASSLLGVCMIEFGRRTTLLPKLKARFPCADLAESTNQLSCLSQAIVAMIDNPRGNNLSIRLDVRGTDFQKLVWSRLRLVPIGETLSYANLARRIGRPSAARAVAQACASNSIAVAIPCHRVIRSSGHISGYKWGVKRKRALLARESATAGR